MNMDMSNLTSWFMNSRIIPLKRLHRCYDITVTIMGGLLFITSGF